VTEKGGGGGSDTKNPALTLDNVILFIRLLGQHLIEPLLRNKNREKNNRFLENNGI
jgi:hypothetical protein